MSNLMESSYFLEKNSPAFSEVDEICTPSCAALYCMCTHLVLYLLIYIQVVKRE